ncbi:fungal-specific transcription factor domain-containing protein [Neofusicoccum parvum]|uniref:Fungal-specific transcription factor domain-containing protein, partial n=1 Tax=Neofusicoccum parvum TaxID=310453 RepID=A0ACB5SNJ7_9PEZI|nr:fungal-specific transcription factor domain-containing protein [Neofusicoccum parvum]
MPTADHADGSGPVPASDGADYPSHSSGPPQRRAKRGKYVSRACEYCQRRKIKCAGGIPCSACSARRLKCSVETLISLPGRNVELIDRLAQVERQLDSLMGHNPAATTATSSSSQSNGSPETTTSSVAEPSRPPHPQAAAAAARRRSTSPEALSKPAVPSFAGETSLAHTLSQVEHRLGAFGVSSLSDATTTASTAAADAEAPSAKLPYAAAADEDGDGHAKDGFVRAALLANGIAVERARWDASLDIFFDEVHILYPMLHVPDVRRFHARMWEDWFLMPRGAPAARLRHRVRVAQVLLCLATGTCTGSARCGGEDGRQAAGWRLYGAAMDVMGDLFEVCESDGPMEALQTLALIVIYLFRLDALERGEKVMSLAVSYAHQLGIHRQKVLERMPFFDDEMYRRVWWCVYILDRRYALESGRPFMTQDFNVDAPLPRNISDDWLSAHRKDTQTSLQMADQIRSHLQEDHSTSIPYLSAIANYSRIVGKVWEALYGARETEVVPGFFLNEYLETLLSKFEAELPPEFLYSPNERFETQFDSMPWWQIKQKMLIRMSIIGQFSQIPDDYPKFMFPFIHHLANATIISLALLIKEPLFRGTYGAATVLAAQTLRKYCTKTWVSGKLIRTVLRLNHMVTAVLGDDLAAIENSNFSQNVIDPTLDTQLFPSSLPANGPFPYLAQTAPNPNHGTVYPSADAAYEWQQSRTMDGEHEQANAATSPGLADMVMTDYDFEEMLQKAVNGTTPFRNDMNRESSSSSKEPSKDVFNTDWFNALFGGRLDSDQLALL